MKRVIAVHDLSGLGQCSLSVALPVLAAMGVRVNPLPTACLSAHTAFPSVGRGVFLDMTREMPETLAHWDALGLRFDGFYSGFLGSPEQMEILSGLLRSLRGPGFLAMVDPVMGDDGVTYRTYTPEMCRKMTELAEYADIITPNLTEAAILLGVGYDPAPDKRKVSRWLEKLSLEGRRSVILTGVSLSPDTLGAACLDRDTGDVAFAQAPLAHGHFSGTGDLFASVAFGSLLRGESLEESCRAAAELVSRASRATVDAGGDPLEGADFELFLGQLASGDI